MALEAELVWEARASDHITIEIDIRLVIAFEGAIFESQERAGMDGLAEEEVVMVEALGDHETMVCIMFLKVKQCLYIERGDAGV